MIQTFLNNDIYIFGIRKRSESFVV